MGQLKIQMGRVEYINHNVNEKLLKEKDIAGVTDFEFNITHLKEEDSHIIEIKIVQGIETNSPVKTILTIESVSKFKITPYTVVLFREPASADLVNILTDLGQTAVEHNSGMFSVIREDYELNDINLKAVPIRKLKDEIFIQTKRFLLN